MKKIAGVLFFVILGVAGIGIYIQQSYKTSFSPVSLNYFMYHLLHPHEKLNKYIIGFLPYWRIEDMKYIKLERLSEVNYFSLSVNNTGDILKVVNNETDPGWREWQKTALKDFIGKTHIMGTKFTVTIAAHNNDVIENILNSPDSQTNLISQIKEITKTNNLDGINLDFEYNGTPDEQYQTLFSAFIKNLNNELKQNNPNTILAVSVLPREGREKSLYDFSNIQQYIDHVIVMSYDYYAANSEIAGPVAPMRGFKDNKFFFDVETTIEDYEKQVPANKIVMGIPYYGWDWAVENGKTIQSKTFPQDDNKNYSAILSFARMKENTDLKPNQCQWDDYALETWCWYKKDNTDHQVWYEDAKSIGIKYDFVNKQNLAGAAIWVLGYDKQYNDLWDLLHEKFSE